MVNWKEAVSIHDNHAITINKVNIEKTSKRMLYINRVEKKR